MNVNKAVIIDNRYQVEEVIGEGAMGKVFRGLDLQTKQSVAIKQLITNKLVDDVDMIERFKREAEALKQVNHPNIVRIIAQVEENGEYYIVMEYLSGGSLADRLLNQPPLSIEQVLKIGVELADALARTHHLNIIHRDIKPANVLLSEDGTPRLTDFGIARLNDMNALTKSSHAVGTPRYLPPEALNGLEIDARSDLWAFGVLLFELLTGQHPFSGKVMADMVQSILTKPPLDVLTLRPDTPPGLAMLIQQLLEKDRNKRPTTARQVAAALESILQNPDVTFGSAKSRDVAPKTVLYRHNLPVQLTNFIGRQHEIAEVKRLLKTTRLLSLIGTGGVGKTRLSIRVASDLVNEYADGVYFVELAPISDPAFVLQTVASCLEVHGGSSASLLDALTDYLRDKQILLILDNCEHLIEECARLAESLLQAVPQLQILATSREVLNIGGEVSWRVPSLSTPHESAATPPEHLTQYESVRLFLERAKTSTPDFAITNDNAPVIAQICTRLDGIPLAIELAAARTKAFSVEQIAARLDDSFRILTSGIRTALPRQQTLQALIDWSYDLLSKSERLLLNRLTVFAGGWTLEAAENICADNEIKSGDVLELLADLVNKSLVVAEQHNKQSRYRLLETIRQYGYAKLQEVGEEKAIRTRHLDYFVKLAEKAEAFLYGPESITWLNYLASEHDNLRAALNWSIDSNTAESGLHLVGLLGWFWHIRGHWTEGRQWLKKTLPEAPNASKAAKAKAMYRIAWLVAEQGVDFAEATSLATQALALCEEIRDQDGAAFALSVLGQIGFMHGTLTSAIDYMEKSLAIYRSLNDKWGIGHALCILGSTYDAHGDLDKAITLYKEALVSRREIGDEDGIAWAVCILGRYMLTKGDLDNAKLFFEESLSIAWQLGVKVTTVTALNGLGIIAYHQGRYEAAIEFFSEGKNQGRELGNKFYALWNTLWLGHVSSTQADFERAETLYKEGLTLAIEIKNGISTVYIGELAKLALSTGNPARAVQLLASINRNVEGMTDFLALAYHGERNYYDHVLEDAKVKLSPADYAATYARGEKMSRADALVFLG